MDRSVFTELMSKPVEVISKDEAKEIMRKSKKILQVNSLIQEVQL